MFRFGTVSLVLLLNGKVHGFAVGLGQMISIGNYVPHSSWHLLLGKAILSSTQLQKQKIYIMSNAGEKWEFLELRVITS